MLTTFLSQNYGAVVGLIVGAGFIFSDKWLPWLKSFKNDKTPAVGPSDDEDVTDVLALHAIQARAKRSGCPKLQAAVRDLEVCFFNHSEPTIAEPAK